MNIDFRLLGVANCKLLNLMFKFNLYYKQGSGKHLVKCIIEGTPHYIKWHKLEVVIVYWVEPLIKTNQRFGENVF